MGDFAKGIKAGMKEEEPEAMAWRPQLLPSGTAAGSETPAASIVDGAQEHAKTIISRPPPEVQRGSKRRDG
jgi:hypothetical protein